MLKQHAGMFDGAIHNPSTDWMHDYRRQIGRSYLLSAEEEVALARAIEVGLFAKERLESRSMSGECRALLEELASSGKKSFDRMVTCNLRLVLAIARSAAGRNAPYVDLVQNGNMGLLIAVQKFDFTRGIKFSTYASWWIRKAVHDQLALSRMIRLPARVLLDVSLIAKVRGDFRSAHGRVPEEAEVAAEVGFTNKQLLEFERRTRQPDSLNRPIGEGAEYGDLIVDPNAVTVEEIVEDLHISSFVRSSLASLRALEADIVRLRFGIGEPAGLSYPQIAEELGISIAEVRKQEREGLSKLAHPSRGSLLRELSAFNQDC